MLDPSKVRPNRRRILLPRGGRQKAPLDPVAPVLGRIGQLEVRLARSRAEIRAAQELRFAVFFGEMQAKPSPVQRLTRRDSDMFDPVCDHLLVLDRARPGTDAEQIVGTYRLLRGEATAGLGFYTASEFEIGSLLQRHPGRRFLELGRSCVLKDYRGKRTVELLWQGIWAYVLHHRIDVLFGCASLPGVDAGRLSPLLRFLRESASAPEEWRVRAVPGRRAEALEAAAPMSAREALGALPPLLKGYLRLGGYIGEDAVVDRHFNTTDVLVVLPVERISPRYVDHYGASAGRFAA